MSTPRNMGTRKRKRAQTVTDNTIKEDHKELIAALVPEVTKGVVSALQAMGVLGKNPNSSNPEVHQVEAVAETSSTSSATDNHSMPNNSGTNQETSNSSTELSPISDIKNPSITRPLGLGVDSKIKSKIWANEFVDLCTLLGMKNKKKSFEIMENQKGECEIKAKRPTYEIRQVSQWVQAFFVFVGIVTEKFPREAPALMKYGDMVQKLGKQAGDEAAIYYDKNFREWRASNPSSFLWGNLNSEIHSEALAVSLGKSRVGSASVSGGKRKFSSSSPQFFRGSSSPKYPCHSFNNRGFCTRERCPYTHACLKCGGTH